MSRVFSDKQLYIEIVSPLQGFNVVEHFARRVSPWFYEKDNKAL